MRTKVEPIGNVIRWLSRKDAHLTIAGLTPKTYAHLLEDAVAYLTRHQDCMYEQLDRESVDRGREMAELVRENRMLRSDLETERRAYDAATAKIEALEGDNVTEYVYWKPSGNDYDFLRCAECGQDLAAPVVEKWEYCPKCGRRIRRQR